jgi:hypothetical protein
METKEMKNGNKGNEKWKQRRKVSRFPFVKLKD